MIFVTGGTGLVGAHLLMALLEDGEKPTAIFRSKQSLEVFSQMEKWYQKPEGFFNQVNWVQCDLNNEYELNKLLQGITTIFHCAALVSFQAKHKYMLEEVNIFGTKHLVDLALANGVKEFYHVSSTAAIGKPKNKQQLITENEQWKKTTNTSNYSITKHFAELEVWRGYEEGMQGAIINPSVIIGPGLWGKSSTNLVETAAKGLMFYTKGINGFVDVRDVANALILCYKKKVKSTRILIVSENLSFKTLFDLFADALNQPKPKYFANKFLSSVAWRVSWLLSMITQKPATITKETARSAHSINKYSNQRSLELLGLQYKTIKQAVEHTVKCYLQKN